MSPPGKLATNVGRSCLNKVTARRLARASSACCDAGRIGSSSATVSSFSSSRAASDRKAAPRRFGRSPDVARYEQTITRMRTSSADGAGSSSLADASHTTIPIDLTPSSTRPEVYRRPTTWAGQVRSVINMDQSLHETVWVRCGKAFALVAGFGWGLVTP